MSKLWKRVEAAWRWTIQRFGPFFVCWLAAGLVALGEDHRAVTSVVAGALFAWAVSLAYEHGRNKVGADYASSLAVLMRDGSAEINIIQTHVYRADEAVRAVASAIEARRAETPSGSVADESAVPKGDARD